VSPLSGGSVLGYGMVVRLVIGFVGAVEAVMKLKDKSLYLPDLIR
jgi:hypothetical protein